MASTLQPTFNCPRCGGEVEYDGHSITLRCKYCGASVSVPKELRPAPAPAPAVIIRPTYTAAPTPVQMGRTSNLGCILIFGFVVFMILVTVVLPLVTVNQALSSIPEMPSVLQDMATEASSFKTDLTRESPKSPTRAPSPTPTPALADVALTIGEKGMGPSQFTNAHLSGLDGDGRLYVGEYIGGRVQVFDTEGQFLNQFFVGDKKTDLLGFAVDRNGVLYVADGGDITRWDGKTGKTLGKLKYSGGPGFGELTLAPDGTLYAMWYERRSGIFTSVEGAREDLVHFDANGKVINVIKGVISSMTESVELDNALAIDGRGNVYIAAEFEQTIFKFDANGKFITRIGSSGDGASQFSAVGPIAIDGQGRIYVEEGSDISVLKADGSRLGKIVTAGAPRCLVFDDKGALWVTTDEHVLKYQITLK